MFQFGAQELLARLAHAGEARLHLAVDLVGAAAADRVVGVVLQQELPGVVDQAVRVSPAVEEVRVRRDRLEHAGEQRLRGVVLLLEVHARRPHAGEDVVVPARRAARPGTRSSPRPDSRDRRRRSRASLAVHELGRPGTPPGAPPGSRPNSCWGGKWSQPLLSSSTSPFARLAHSLEELADLLDGALRVDAPPGVRVPELLEARGRRVAVAAALVDREHLAAVRRAPQVLEAQVLQLVAVAARVDERVDARAAQELGHLGDVPERVGHVADLLHAAEGARDRVSDQQVPDRGLAADEELVGQDVPGADRRARRRTSERRMRSASSGRASR